MSTLLFYLPFLGFFSLSSVFFERKIAAFIQRRIGPNTTGYQGIGQTTADFFKLLQKSWILPHQINGYLFYLLPYLLFILTFSAFAVLPVHSNWFGNHVWGVLYIFFVLAMEIVLIVLIGWISQNQYALLASFRTAAQMISYEIPFSLCILIVIYFAGTVDLQIISLQQSAWSSPKIYLLGLSATKITVNHIGGFLLFHVMQCPILLLVYGIFFITSLAICKRAPFDFPESESELVGGYHVEYTGWNFALLMFVEYSYLLLMSMLGVVLFWGSWYTPLPNIGPYLFAQWTSGTQGTFSAAFWGIFWLIYKTMFVVFIKMWIRWSLPRMRYDQLMLLCWKKLFPWTLLLFLGVLFWQI